MKVIKVLIIVFLIPIGIITFLYFFNHYSNAEIIKKAQDDIETNKNNYIELRNYLKNNSDSGYMVVVAYRSGLNYISFSLKDSFHEKNYQKKVEYYMSNLKRSFTASYSKSDGYMFITFPYSNYNLYHSSLLLCDDENASIKKLTKSNYILYNPTDKFVKNKNCIINIKTEWLLLLKKSR